MAHDSRFTPDAARRWAELGGRAQTRLLNNIFCFACRKPGTIVRFTGKMRGEDLVLEGSCMACDSPVARVIEGS
ncbi:MAG: hypothetical protein AAF560_23165 [Acidobacteriota bacterium]